MRAGSRPVSERSGVAGACVRRQRIFRRAPAENIRSRAAALVAAKVVEGRQIFFIRLKNLKLRPAGLSPFLFS